MKLVTYHWVDSSYMDNTSMALVEDVVQFVLERYRDGEVCSPLFVMDVTEEQATQLEEHLGGQSNGQ
jgi:hypothetical protein